MTAGWVRACLASLALLGACEPAGKDSAEGEAAQTGASIPAYGSLQWAVAGEWRTDQERARDTWRKPADTLSFFGVEGSDTVVELYPGGGWYTAVLGPYLKAGGGKLYAAHFDPASSDYARTNLEAFRAAFVDRPETFGDITVTVASKTSEGVAPDGSADVVLTFRNVHNWMMGGFADKMFADAFRALKPGGVLGIEEHRLPSARDQDPTGSTGYVQESFVIQLAEAAGFQFVGSSEINANPADTADHPLGVWMLPPTLRAPKSDDPLAATYSADVYKAIGESDRMTLKFMKPMDAATPTPTP